MSFLKFTFSAALLLYPFWATADECDHPQDLQINAICTVPELKETYFKIPLKQRKDLQFNCRTTDCLRNILEATLNGKKAEDQSTKTFEELKNNGTLIRYSKGNEIGYTLNRPVEKITGDENKVPLFIPLNLIPPRTNGNKIVYLKTRLNIDESTQNYCNPPQTVIHAAICSTPDLKELYDLVEQKEEQEKDSSDLLIENHIPFIRLLLNAQTKEQLKSALKIRLRIADKTETSEQDRIKQTELLKDIEMLPSGLLLPPPASYQFYVRGSIIRNKLFFLDYYLLRDLKQKAKENRTDTPLLTNEDLIDQINNITIEALKGNTEQEKAVSSYETYFKSSCLECIFEDLTKSAEYPDPGTRVSPACSDILKSKAFLNQKDHIFFKDGPNTYIFLTDYQGTAHAPSVKIFRAAMGESAENVVPIKAMPFFWAGKVSFFKHGFKLYYADSDWESTDFAIFEFDTKAEIFKDACRFKSTVVASIPEKGAENSVCQAVADKKYKTYEAVDFDKLIPAEEFHKFKTEVCLFSKKDYEKKTYLNKPPFPFKECMDSTFNNNVLLTSETMQTNAGLKVDYNNDGKDDILLGAYYASGSGSGCDHTLFRIYDSPVNETRLITNGKKEDVYFHGGNTGDGYTISCNKGRQKIVAISGKNYLLTLDKTGPQRLDQITTQQDGTNSIKQLCSFSPKMEYK